MAAQRDIMARLHAGLQGSVVVAAFPIGLSYFYPAMPKRPPARGNTDLTYNHCSGQPGGLARR